jgi:MFS family permease
MHEQPLNKGQWLVLAAAFLGWMFDGVEIGLFPLVARPALHDLLPGAGDAAVGAWNGWIVAAFLVGAAVGGVAFGWLGDRIGRVRTMALTVFIYSIFTGAGYFATQAWHLAAFRFIASLGMGGQWAVAVALVVECWPDRHRTKLAGAIGAAANFGFLAIATIAYFNPVVSGSWRWIMLVGASPAVLSLIILAFVPESEKWKQTRQTPARTPLVEIFASPLRNRTLLAIIFSSIPLIGTWAAVAGWVPLWVEQKVQVDLIEQHAPELNLGLAAPHELQSGLVEAKQRLTPTVWRGITSEAASVKAGSQIVLAIGAILGCFVAPLLGGYWGRRPIYFLLCLLSLGSCAYLFRFSHALDWQFMALIGVVGTLTAAFYGWLPLYLPELFPTRVRATGQGLSFNAGRVLAAVGALHMGELVRVLGGDYATAGANITLIYGLGLVLIWFGPETRGKPLPD